MAQFQCYTSMLNRSPHPEQFTYHHSPSSDTFRRHLKTHLFSNNTAIDYSCYHPRLRFELVLTYSALQLLTTYLLSYVRQGHLIQITDC